MRDYTRLYHWPMQEGITLLGAVLLAHISECEQSKVHACIDHAAWLAKLFNSSRFTIMKEVDLLCERGFLTKETMNGKGWRLNLTPATRDRMV